MSSFTELGLSEELLKVCNELGFETPTEIQSQAIPMLLDEPTDFIGLAQTGTGKTAAFGLPLLELIDPNDNNTQALILAPTRELGQQIAGQLEIFSKYMKKVNVLAVYGGTDIRRQINDLKRPQHVIIATPGRLIDLINRRAVRLDDIGFAVLDEADEMLNMGFKEDIDEILSYTPDDKLTWLFSATMPKEIRRIVDTYMTNPKEVKIDAKHRVNKNIEHQYALVSRHNKTEALTRFLDVTPAMRGVVFCRTKRDTQALAETLMERQFRADALHGDLSQTQRDRVMKRFKAHELQVLIATDVAARGIDVNDLTHVFHYSLPDDLSYYTHRAGRTARAGKKGLSIAFLNNGERYRLRRISQQLELEFEKIDIPSAKDIADARIEKWCEEVLLRTESDKITEELLDKATTNFAELSKEQLIEKLMMIELDKFYSRSSSDLNESSRPERGRSGGRSGNRRSRGRDRDRSFRDKGRPFRRDRDDRRDRRDRQDRDSKPFFKKDRFSKSRSSDRKDDTYSSEGRRSSSRDAKPADKPFGKKKRSFGAKPVGQKQDSSSKSSPKSTRKTKKVFGMRDDSKRIPFGKKKFSKKRKY